MAVQSPVDLVFKVLVIGESGTGKTSLVRKYVHGIFEPSLKPTVGVDCACTAINETDCSVTLHIWDVAGLERCGQMTRSFYQSAIGAVVVWDSTRPETFDGAIKWKQDLDSKVFLGNSGKPIPCILLANKCDMGKLHMTNAEMDAFCLEHGFVGWYETSAKEDTNVATAFLALVEQMRMVKDRTISPKPRSGSTRAKPQTKCCSSAKSSSASECTPLNGQKLRVNSQKFEATAVADAEKSVPKHNSQ